MKQRIINIVKALNGDEELIYDIYLDEFTINSIETIPDLQFNIWRDEYEYQIEFHQLKYTQLVSIIEQLEVLF